MFEQDDRDPRDQMVLEARRADSPSAGAGAAQSYELRYQFRPPADGPVGLLERPEQPTVERPGAAPKPEGEEHGAGEQVRKGFLRRRPIAAAFGLLFLALAG